MSQRLAVPLIAVILLTATGPASADDGDPVAGRMLAETECARCHALGANDASAEEEAPPFRVLKSKWPLENLEEAFAEGIVVGHIMPEFQFEPEQIHDLIAFLRGIKTGTD